MADERYLTFMGRGPKKIIHWEHWSDPDAATYLSGIDYYEKPKSCMQKLNEMYPFVGFWGPAEDKPIPRIEEQTDKGKGRWGSEYRDNWQQEDASHRFKDLEEMLRFSPLAQGDFTGWNVVESSDFSSEEIIYERYRKHYPAE
jgi:hypothetical protein